MTAPRLPTGTVTFLFTDIEGSTRLLQELGEGYRRVQDDHAALMRSAIADGGGVEIRTEGDSFFAVFPTPAGALGAAVNAQRSLAGHPWSHGGPLRVRMGMHTGEGVLGGDDYLGIDVNLAARIAAAANGGQVLLSEAARALVERNLPKAVTLRDLGSHRLKDFNHAQRLHDVAIDGVPHDFPPPRTLEVPTNLPAQRTSFVGREHEVARVKKLLVGPGLLTLTGPGGSGKTRLALRVAGELREEYPDGVFFVDLAAIGDPRLIPSRIAESTGIRAEGARPVLDTLQEQLREREMLLILDNFEQLLDGAPMVADLLGAVPRLRILATSREPLHISGEQELSVPPLELPDAGSTSTEDLAASEAVTLFVQRATAVNPGFRVTDEMAPAIAELCRRLDGLPLAVELAASRVKLLTPQAMVERLGGRLDLLAGGPVDLPARQRTLREAIGWSYELLDEPERALFRRLSVFAGGWTVEAAEVVVNPEGGRDMLAMLESLVDKSLVTMSPESRSGMLQTIRAFGIEQLEAANESDGIRERHASFFRFLAVAAQPHLRGVDQIRWLDQLDVEHDNLRAALRFSISSENVSMGLSMVAALWRFWHLRGHLAEGRQWAEEMLFLPAAAERTIERAGALTALGGLAYWQEDFATCRRAYEEALAIAQELGDRGAEAEGYYNLAYPPAYEDDFDTARELLVRARSLFEELGVRRGIADTEWLLAITARLDGDVDTARARAEQSLRIHREIGDRFGITDALHVLGRIAMEQGDMGTAGSVYLEALKNDEEVGNRTGMGIVLDNLASKAGLEGRHLRAVRLAGASAAIKTAAGGHAPPPFIDLGDPLAPAREALGDAAVEAAWKEGQAMTLDQAVEYARQEVG